MKFLIKTNNIRQNLTGYQRIGIFVTTYSLMLYLIISSRREIKSTLFFFTESLASKINISNLDCVVVTDSISNSKYGFMRLIYSGLVRLIIGTKFRIIRKKDIFCQDHSYPFSSLLLNDCSYSVIEDGTANYIESYTRAPRYNKLKKAIISLVYGKKITLSSYGNSELAKKVILTGIMPILTSMKEKCEIIDPHELWRNLSQDDKDGILQILNLDYSDVRIASTKKVLLLTQPSGEGFSEAELVEIYRRGIRNFRDDEILIKTHPRNNVDFKKYFPHIEIIDKPFPVNLLFYWGCKFNYVISISSSALYNIGENTKIIKL